MDQPEKAPFHERLSRLRKVTSPIDPLAVLELVHNAEDIAAAWAQMAEKFNDAGFETCAFAIVRRSSPAPLAEPPAGYWGNPVIDRYVALMMSHPEAQKITPPIQLVRKTTTPVVKFGDELIVEEDSQFNVDLNNLTRSLGITAGVIVPFHDRADDCLMGVGWWGFGPVEAMKKKWKNQGPSFTLAVAYFTEAVREKFNPMGVEVVELSAREQECLLWAASGYRTSEIADILSLADSTVNEYLTRAMKKLGASTRSQACAKAVIRGLFAS